MSVGLRPEDAAPDARGASPIAALSTLLPPTACTLSVDTASRRAVNDTDCAIIQIAKGRYVFTNTLVILRNVTLIGHRDGGVTLDGAGRVRVMNIGVSSEDALLYNLLQRHRCFCWL